MCPGADDGSRAPRPLERVHVKFCGLVRPQDVAAAVRLGADFLGFVFAPGSRRCLDLGAAERLLAECDTGAARRVGVFQDQPASFVNAAVRRCRLDLAQLHGHEPRDYARALDVPALVVLRVRAAAPRGRAAASIAAPAPGPLPLPPNVFAALIDAEDAAGRSGGRGLRADSAALQQLLASLPTDARIFLSGGLTPTNVAEAVAAHRPYAVDVSSGVESEPGIKDHDKMREFRQAVASAS